MSAGNETPSAKTVSGTNSRTSGVSVLTRRWTRARIFSATMTGVVGVATVVATIPLFSVLYMVGAKGLAHFKWSMLWLLPPGVGMAGGGFGNALLGTMLVVALAAAISVPFGVGAAIFLTEFSGWRRAAQVVRFTANVLSGLPSILAGVFIFAAVVTVTQRFSLWAGALALAVLMLPIITLATEQALLRVPRMLREASVGLGATPSQTIMRVVVPAAYPAILTGVTLAVARAAGETAPLIFTALFSEYWIKGLSEPTASLAVLIYNYSSVPYENQVDLAWSASLVLITLVLVTNIVTQIVARRAR